jgi:hypothetical protein
LFARWIERAVVVGDDEAEAFDQAAKRLENEYGTPGG